MVVIMQTKTKRRRTTLHRLVIIAFLTFGLSYLNLVSNNRRLLEFLAVMLTKNEDRYHVVVQHHQTSTTIANENSNDATTNVEGAVPVEEEDWMHRTNKEDENVATTAAAAATSSTTRGPRSTAPSSSASFNSSSNSTDISTLDFYSEKENGRDETIIIGGKDAKTNNGTFQNSEKWLKGPRFSNIVETRMSDDDFVASLIMDASPLMSDNGSEHLLEHSICPSGSIFLKWQESQAAAGGQRTSQDLLDLRLEEENKQDKVMMDGWKNMTTSSSTTNVASLTMRLMYLAIHEHQHKPARAEAKARWLEKNQNKTTIVLSSNSTTLSSVPLQHTNTKNQTNNKLGPFDFECDHDTKYIITGIPSRRGFGSNFRAYGAEPIMLGLIMNRVALHMNSLHLGPRILRTNFFYSKCPQKDMHCMFMPLSPCVVTHDDIANAVMLPKDELVKFRSTGILDEIYAKEKVLVVETSNVHVLPKGFHDVFVKKIEQLYNREKIKHTDEASNSSNNSTSGTKHYPLEFNDELMEKVKQFILDPENKWYMWYPAIMYGMRPNEYLKGELDRILSNVIPKDFNPATSIGIPIRDGDKCIREAQCLSFDQYMKLAGEMAVKRTNHKRSSQQWSRGGKINSTFVTSQPGNMYDTILLSSDSKNITQQRFNYTNNKSFPFKIIANDEDIGQGHGIPPFYRNDADQIMISTTMAALKMQLLPETLIYNGCSNFHKLIVNLYSGCGRDVFGYFESLQDNTNKEFRVRCSW